ncbi:putative Bifunctional methylthioribulose-1-phosphate dehydratase/enolase-phosphatase E1 2 [Hibiscus syriacus]|uniref:Bifunctional methylthioribulose-1-phosphate dehydratase/enolase-phosphatase E1 2 n=1 Tax=Hibiscus syriacus TaxID=106335 RepID=A0A6A2XR66_HIBSY|nr:putative Bifunctional methylthioribulose-1-phosphate dehydratase/enolase-phosphatase E1 2 [Hibiscus syriacus]
MQLSFCHLVLVVFEGTLEVNDENGVKRWKKVEVKLEDHVNVPVFPPGLSPESYDSHLSDYLSKIAMEQLPHNRPLWNIHIIKYPTSNAAGNIIFKLHHSLGDGYSLMGALLSCLQRADNPSVPLTFPSRGSAPTTNLSLESNKCSPKFPYFYEFKPFVISTITFSLDHIKQIKTKLGMTINDVIVGIIFLGARSYMQATVGESSKKSNERSTALVLLNTRDIREYKSVKEMLKPGADKAWGNQFSFLHVSLPELRSVESCNPLDFVRKAHKLIQQKRNSGAVFLTGLFLECLRKYRGPEAAAKYIHTTLKNSSLAVTNLIGPVEQMAVANYPIKSLYFMVAGSPQSLVTTMVSYMGKLRVAIGTEKDHIDPGKLKSSIENAFRIIMEAANEVA